MDLTPWDLGNGCNIWDLWVDVRPGTRGVDVMSGYTIPGPKKNKPETWDLMDGKGKKAGHRYVPHTTFVVRMRNTSM